MTSTDTMDNAASAEPTRSRRGKGEGLSSMVIPELRKMATEMGIKRTSGMRKGDLIEAIQAQQRNANDKEQGNKDSQPAAQNGVAASTGNTVDKGSRRRKEVWRLRTEERPAGASKEGQH